MTEFLIMETENELVEMKVRSISEAINVNKLADDLTFDEVLSDEEKMDLMMVDSQNFKLLLEEKEEPHRVIMAIINVNEADLLDVALDAPEATELSLHYQMLKLLQEQYGVTVEKAVTLDDNTLQPQTKVFLRKPDGTSMVISLNLVDALVITILGKAPFYVSTEFLKDRRPDFAKSVPSVKVSILRKMPLFYLEEEMKTAIRKEEYEYAELIKREIQARKDKKEQQENNETK